MNDAEKLRRALHPDPDQCEFVGDMHTLLRRECLRLQREVNEWWSAAQKALADQIAVTVGPNGEVPEPDTTELYEMYRGRGWSSVPDDLAFILCKQRDEAVADNKRLRAEVETVQINERSRCLDILKAFLLPDNDVHDTFARGGNSVVRHASIAITSGETMVEKNPSLPEREVT